MSAHGMPTSVHQAEFTIAGVILKVHNLDDGRRVIESEGMHQLIAALGAGLLSEDDAAALARVIRS